MKAIQPLATALLVLGFSLAAISTRADVTMIPTPGCNLYRLAVASAAGQRQIVGAAYDNRVCAFDLSGKQRGLRDAGPRFGLPTGTASVG